MRDFVDSHVHFWDRAQDIGYDQLDDPAPHSFIGDIDGLRVARFSVAEFEAQSRFQNVTKVVHVTFTSDPDTGRETRWLVELNAAARRPDGLVAHVDLAAADASSRIDALAATGLLRGLRGARSTDELATPSWRRGFAVAAEQELVFCHPFTLGESGAALALAEQFPAATICFDQAGLPFHRDEEYFARWRRDVELVAGADNVVCKISSLGMRDHRWTQDSLRPWVETCLESFGADRCFFGSNWPMDSLFSSYPDLINAYRALVSSYSEDEQVALLSRNAERIFKL